MFGDGATSKGDVYEAMNFAGVHKLPVVFVATNNQWAISVPLRLQTASETLAQKAIAAGFIGEQVDGSDVVAMHAAAEEAIAAARDGQGPRFIEAVTYRLGDHTTSDDASRYRSPESRRPGCLRMALAAATVSSGRCGSGSSPDSRNSASSANCV